MVAGAGLHVGGRAVGTDAEAFERSVRYLVVPEDRQSDPGFDALAPGTPSPLIDPMRAQIVEAMQAQGAGIAFDALEDALNDIHVRVAAMACMRAFNAGRYDADYFSETLGLKCCMGWFPEAGQTHSRHWGPMTPDPYGAQFAQRDRLAPHVAMAPGMDNLWPFRGECAGAFQLAVYQGLLGGLGDAGFDAQAAGWGAMFVGPWRIGPNGQTPNPATLYMLPARLGDPPIPGDYLYFKNKDDYLHWAPNGFWTGLNAMYMGTDALGTRHYTGLGAAWLSEANLRASVAAAYYHDCYPHTIADPDAECRFTQRRLLSIPKTAAAGAAVPDRREAPAPGAPLDAGRLARMGFEARDGVLSASERPLGALAEGLGLDPRALRQANSAPLENPPHVARMPGGTLVVEYAEAEAGRHDPEARVRAHVRLDGGTT